MANIQGRIKDYLEAAEEMNRRKEIRAGLVMGKLRGIGHLDAVRTFKRAGFEVIRQSGHIITSNVFTDDRRAEEQPRQRFHDVRDRARFGAYPSAIP